MTVYVDELFALNAALDYLLLRAACRLTGTPAKLWRVGLAAGLGGAYAALALMPALGFLQTAGMKGVLLVLMLLCAFGWRRETVRLGLLTLALAAAFAGLALLCVQLFGTGLLLLGGSAYYPVSAFGLLVMAAAVYLLAQGVFARLFQHGGKQIVPLTLLLAGAAAPVRALRDTGNTLCDPMTGEPVLVVSWQTAARLLPDAALTAAELTAPDVLMTRLAGQYPALRFRLIPYRAVGTRTGLLLAVRCEAAEKNGRVRRVLAAFSPTPVSDGGTFDALTGG